MKKGKDRMIIYLSMIEGEEQKRSFENTYKENYLIMYYIALGMLKNPVDAENAVHEAFLSIAERYKKYFKLSCREMTGLCVTIVKNKAIDQLRARKRYSDEEIENLIIPGTYRDYEPVSYIENKEEYQHLHKMMNNLPDVLRVVLDLKYFYNYSNKEISKILNIPVKAVETRLYRAKMKMRELLEYER